VGDFARQRAAAHGISVGEDVNVPYGLVEVRQNPVSIWVQPGADKLSIHELTVQAFDSTVKRKDGNG